MWSIDREVENAGEISLAYLKVYRNVACGNGKSFPRRQPHRVSAGGAGRGGAAGARAVSHPRDRYRAMTPAAVRDRCIGNPWREFNPHSAVPPGANYSNVLIAQKYALCRGTPCS